MNFQRFLHTYYKMGALIEDQNSEFMHFWNNRRFLLPESDEILCLYCLAVNLLYKLQCIINKTLITLLHKDWQLKKNSSFDILSLADQLHYSKYILYEDPKLQDLYLRKPNFELSSRRENDV